MEPDAEIAAQHDAVLVLARAQGKDLSSHPTDCRIGSCADPGGIQVTITDEQVQAQVDAAVAAAVAPLQQEIARLQADDQEAAAAAARDAAVAEATAPLQAQVDDLQSKLDAAEAEVNAGKAALQAREEADAAEAAERAAADAKAGRVTAVEELGLFTDEQIAEKSDGWAALTDEAWTDKLDEYKGLKDRFGDIQAPPPPPKDAPKGGAMTDKVDGDDARSATRKVLDQRSAGRDLTKLIA